MNLYGLKVQRNFWKCRLMVQEFNIMSWSWTGPHFVFTAWVCCIGKSLYSTEMCIYFVLMLYENFIEVNWQAYNTCEFIT